MDEEFNASDIESEAPVPSFFRETAQRNLQRLLENAPKDRMETKKASKQLEHGLGAPSTQWNQLLWANRFNAFLEHPLQEPLDRPFTGDHIFAFVDSIISTRSLTLDTRSANCIP